MIRTLVIALAISCTALPLAAQKRPVTHEDIYLMKRVGEPVVSPDGRWAVFSVTQPDYDPAKSQSDLWIVATDGSSGPRQLTATRGPESSVDWAPDSKSIVFSARREGDEASQVYHLPVFGGEAVRLTSLPSGASNAKWRPDGKALLFESTIKGPRKNPGKSTARVYDSMPVRYWNAWLDDSRPHIFVMELGGQAKDILANTQLAESPGFSGIRSGLSSDTSLQSTWSPNGAEIVFAAATNTHEIMRVETETHLFRMPATGGEPVQITQKGASYTKPAFSPDGKLFALQDLSPEPGKRLYSLSRLTRFDWPKVDAPLIATASLDRSVGDFAFTGRDAVLFTAEDEGFVNVFRVARNGGKVDRVTQLTEGGYSGLKAEQDRIVANFGSSTQPNEVVLIEGGKHKQLTSFNKDKLATLDMPKPEHFWFTAKNGKKIHSVLVPPPSRQPGRKYPLLVFPHGGPNAMSGDAFSTRWNYHLLTSPGYVLLMTNYTGSTGFGEKFADDIERDVLRGPAQEILEAAEYAGKQYSYIDMGRQCALGASYGGYLMNWFNGHANQFKCLVNHAGASNNESQYGANDGGMSRELRMGAPVWSGKGQWMDQSPFRYAEKWKTPTLITQGELDYRVPVNESMMTFKVLQRLGVPTRFMVFPDEGHWILKGENNRHHMQEVINWLAKYLQ